jgi:hypothetical protein
LHGPEDNITKKDLLPSDPLPPPPHPKKIRKKKYTHYIDTQIYYVLVFVIQITFIKGSKPIS